MDVAHRPMHKHVYMSVKLLTTFLIFIFFFIDDRASQAEFDSHGVGIPILVLTFCLLLTCSVVLLNCLNNCNSRLKYSVSDVESQKISDDYVNDTSNFTMLPDRAQEYMVWTQESGKQAGASGINLPLSTSLTLPDGTIQIISPSMQFLLVRMIFNVHIFKLNSLNFKIPTTFSITYYMSILYGICILRS